MTVSPAPESKTRGFWQRRPSVLLKLAQVRITLLEEIEACICPAARTYTWLLDWAISRSFPLHAISLTTTAFVTEIVFQGNCFDPKQSVVSLSRSSSSGSTKNLMFVLVDVDPLMRLSLETCLTGTHQSPSLTVFS